MILDYADGGTLASRISDALHARQPFAVATACEWITQLCSAVSFMHERNVLHRDISAGNIYFATAESTRLVLGDLGLSKKLDMRSVGSARVGSLKSSIRHTSKQA